MISAVKQGFLNFVKNIGKHLQTGLIAWLTGTMGESGITIPENFDLKGVFSLVTQILGLTYDFIRGQAVNRLGEEKVSYLEKGEETFKILATEGLPGIWHLLQDKVGDIKTMVMDGITDFVTNTIVQAGIEFILSMLTPASAFVKACKMIIDVVKFFIERAQQIGDLINAIIDSVTAIASGATGQAIQAIENALAKSLPVALGFLASLLGLGGITQKIQAIIQKVRQPVVKAVNWVIDKGAKVANKIGGKFKNSKVGKKVIGYKKSAEKKYEAGKKYIEDKKAAGQKYFDEKKQAVHQSIEKQKNKFANTKLGKGLTRVNDAANKKLDALEKKRQAFNNKIEKVKEWPGKQLEKVENKAAEWRGKAKDKLVNSKLGKGVSEKWDKAKEWGSKKKDAVKNKVDKLGGKVKDKLGFGKDKKNKDSQDQKAKDSKTDQRTYEQKKNDLDLALAEAEQLMQNKELSFKDIKKLLPKIKDKYRMTSCKLVIDKDAKDKTTAHIEAEINPKRKGDEHERDNSAKRVKVVSEIGLKGKDGKVIEAFEHTGTMEDVLLKVRETQLGTNEITLNEDTRNYAMASIQVSGVNKNGQQTTHNFPIPSNNGVMQIFSSGTGEVKKEKVKLKIVNVVTGKTLREASVPKEIAEQLPAIFVEAKPQDEQSQKAQKIEIVVADKKELENFITKKLADSINREKYVPFLDKHSEQAVWQAFRTKEAEIAKIIDQLDLVEIIQLILHIHSEREMCSVCAATSNHIMSNIETEAPAIWEVLQRKKAKLQSETNVTSTIPFRGKAPRTQENNLSENTSTSSSTTNVLEPTGRIKAPEKLDAEKVKKLTTIESKVISRPGETE